MQNLHIKVGGTVCQSKHKQNNTETYCRKKNKASTKFSSYFPIKTKIVRRKRNIILEILSEEVVSE